MSPVFYTPHIAMPHFCKVCQLWYHHEKDAGGCCHACWISIKKKEYNTPAHIARNEMEEE